MSVALERAIQLSNDRSLRARELKDAGKRIVGYLCLYPPVELIHAAGLVPFRITGSPQPVSRADAYLESLMCPFVRSCFDCALKGEFDFIDGMIWPHTCDNIHKTFDIWKHYVPRRYFHYLEVPHMIDSSSCEFFTEELEILRGSLEETGGAEITDALLVESITIYNENRSLLRDLSGMRRHNPPLLSGTEMMQVMRASTGIPVDESNEMLKGIINEIKERQGGLENTRRLLVYGSEIDDIGLFTLLEGCGATVVVEDTCMGTKYYLNDVATEGKPIESLARHYLSNITCPRTFRPWPGTRTEDIENRLGYLKRLVEEYNVNGAVLYILMFCDTFEFDAPDVRDYLKEVGIQSLHIEDDYRLSGKGSLTTRIEAFLEMIG